LNCIFDLSTMKDFKKYYIIPATPEEVYKALTVESTLVLWTGDPAEMKAEAGTEFSLWDGNIVGKNLEFEEGKKIVQQWYFGDQEEQSIVTIKLHSHEQGTSMEVRQTNIPDEDYEDIIEGWNHTYVAGLIDFYDEATP
jgi:activator of HSP90 ATPase